MCPPLTTEIPELSSLRRREHTRAHTTQRHAHQHDAQETNKKISTNGQLVPESWRFSHDDCCCSERPLKNSVFEVPKLVFRLPPFLLKHDYRHQAHWITKRLLGSSSLDPEVPQNRNQKGSLLRKTSESPWTPPHVAPWSHAEVLEEGPLRTSLKSKSPTRRVSTKGYASRRVTVLCRSL